MDLVNLTEYKEFLTLFKRINASVSPNALDLAKYQLVRDFLIIQI